MSTKTKSPIYNLIILDKSGSMAAIRNEAISGLNETLSGIRAAQLSFIDTQEHYVSLAVFCSCGIEMIYDAIPIKEAVDLKTHQYTPCCCTPLYDAIGNSVNALKMKIAEREEDASVLVTIITDGYENSSREWTAKTVSKLIEECKEKGWLVSFIGAGEDILKTAEKLSIDNTMLWDNSPEGTAKMFATEKKARKIYFSKIGDLFSDCSPEEKLAARKELAKGYYK